MQLVDIFHLSTGDIVFAGRFSEEIPVIRNRNKYMANLVVNGSLYQENIQITGEMSGGRHPDGYRAIATIEEVDLSSEFIKTHDCQLILLERSSE